MSKFQDQKFDSTVRDKFDTSNVFPIVPEQETRTYTLMGRGELIDKQVSQVFPLCLQDLQELRNGFMDLPKFSIPPVGVKTFLIRHPFRPYELVPIDTKEEVLIMDHCADLAAIFSALGAIACEQEVKITEIKKLKRTLTGKLKFKTLKGKATLSEEEIKNIENNFSLNIKRIPAEDAGYEKAKNLANKSNIHRNKEIDNILKQFAPEIGGLNKKYILNENLTENLHKTLDIVADINATGVFEFSGKFSSDYELRKEMRIKREIYFDEDLYKEEMEEKKEKKEKKEKDKEKD